MRWWVVQPWCDEGVGCTSRCHSHEVVGGEVYVQLCTRCTLNCLVMCRSTGSTFKSPLEPEAMQSPTSHRESKIPSLHHLQTIKPSLGHLYRLYLDSRSISTSVTISPAHNHLLRSPQAYWYHPRNRIRHIYHEAITVCYIGPGQCQAEFWESGANFDY